MRADQIVRLPIRPLWEAAGRPDGVVAFAKELGVKQTTVHRWYKADGIPFATCDHLAITLGLHPMSVWGEDWYRAEIHDLFTKKELQRESRNARAVKYRQRRKASV